MNETANPSPRQAASRSGLAAWCLFDWANSAYPTVIMTFVFAAYFTEGVAASPTAGTEAWGYAVSMSAFLIAVLGPVLGAIADNGGRRKPWLFALMLMTAGAASGLWLVEPDPSWMFTALVLVALGNAAFETGMVFYNAMLADIADDERVGRLSGWGWGLGYLGGLSCLALVLIGFVQTDTPWFGLDKDSAEHLRAVGPIVAVWTVVFALPLFLLTPDRPTSGVSPMAAVRLGLVQLKTTFVKIRDFRDVVRFLIARMIYTDGLNTLFAFGGIYAAGTFGFSFEDLILFGIAINVTAGLGAFAFGWLDDRMGPKQVIIIALICLIILGTAILLIESRAAFWGLGLALGIFMGPAQSASRSMMARLAPADMRTEMFGLYALSGKATAFIGPALLAWVTATTDSQRLGMATIVVFLIAGLILMRRVPSPGRA